MCQQTHQKLPIGRRLYGCLPSALSWLVLVSSFLESEISFRNDRTPPRAMAKWRGIRFDIAKQGDNRNVADEYRYLTVEAIKADLDTKRTDLHIAIENWQHDLNIGTIVRTANAFN